MLTELRQRWAAGEKASQIATALGISKNAVVGKAHRLHLESRPSPISNPLSKDTRDDIDRRLREGEGPLEIAATLGVSDRYVRQRADKALRQKPLATLPSLATAQQPPATRPSAASAALRINAGAAITMPTTPSGTPAKRPEPLPQTLRSAPSAAGVRTVDGCRWPMWGFREQPTHVYCGGDRPDMTKPYCAEHSARASVPRKILVAG